MCSLTWSLLSVTVFIRCISAFCWAAQSFCSLAERNNKRFYCLGVTKFENGDPCDSFRQFYTIIVWPFSETLAVYSNSENSWVRVLCKFQQTAYSLSLQLQFTAAVYLVRSSRRALISACISQTHLDELLCAKTNEIGQDEELTGWNCHLQIPERLRSNVTLPLCWTADIFHAVTFQRVNSLVSVWLLITPPLPHLTHVILLSAGQTFITFSYPGSSQCLNSPSYRTINFSDGAAFHSYSAFIQYMQTNHEARLKKK